LEFLGINLSLQGWSYVMFVASILFYTNTALVSFTRPSGFGMVTMILTYLGLQVTTFIYAIATNQPGFLFTILFQTILLLLMGAFHRKATDDQDQ